MNVDTDIAVIGGGVHAVALGAQLRRRVPFWRARRMLLLDPAPTLMAQWYQGTRGQRLTELRTPMKIHLDPAEGPESLLTFARRHGSRGSYTLDSPAPVPYFNAHAAGIVHRYGLEAMHRRALVASVRRSRGGGFTLAVSGPDGRGLLRASKVVMAVGLGTRQMPQCPDSDRIVHAHDIDLRTEAWQEGHGERICVIGGGLTAATIAAELADRGFRVTLCVRRGLTVSQLEADPAWLPDGPLHAAFLRMSPAARRRQLMLARVGRGITPAVWLRLQQQIERRRLDIREEVGDAAILSRGGLPHLHGDDKPFKLVICATGYRSGLSTLDCLKPLAKDIEQIGDLPVLRDDYESMSEPGLYFTGRLAELRGGPLSRNIPGAMHAAPLIAEAYTA